MRGREKIWSWPGKMSWCSGCCRGKPTPLGTPCILCVSQLSLKHDAARVVQSCVKNGSSEHRTAVFSELRGEQCLVGHMLVM